MGLGLGECYCFCCCWYYDGGGGGEWDGGFCGVIAGGWW